MDKPIEILDTIGVQFQYIDTNIDIDRFFIYFFSFDKLET